MFAEVAPLFGLPKLSFSSTFVVTDQKAINRFPNHYRLKNSEHVQALEQRNAHTMAYDTIVRLAFYTIQFRSNK